MEDKKTLCSFLFPLLFYPNLHKEDKKILCNFRFPLLFFPATQEQCCALPRGNAFEKCFCQSSARFALGIKFKNSRSEAPPGENRRASEGHTFPHFPSARDTRGWPERLISICATRAKRMNAAPRACNAHGRMQVAWGPVAPSVRVLDNFCNFFFENIF